MQRLFAYFERNSIRFELFRLVVVLASAALVISLVGGTMFEWNNQQKHLRQSLATIAEAAGTAASAAIVFNDSRAAKQALQILVARKEIEAAAFYSLQGIRLASYGDDAQLPRNIDQLSEHLPDFGLFLSSATLYQPIWLDDSTIGYIFVRASLRDYRHGFLLHAALAIGVNLLGLLLVLGFGLRFLDNIVKPVKELADTARQVRRAGNFSLRATPPGSKAARNEVGELIDSFNAMLAEIEQRERELSNYHTSLERMVLERTEALLAANAELQAAKDTAEAATVAKSRFLAAASHDLRQPIQAINLFKDALNKTALSAEQQRISNFLARSIQSLGDLLNALLDISKLDAGAIRPAPELLDVQDLFGSIDAEFSPLAAAKSLRFKLHFSFGPMSLCTDGKLLQSLLRNLIGNALKYTERGGILVAIRRRGQQALIQIWDTGIGIAPENLATIFDEYFQVANPERDKAKGLGLGLSIVKRLAKLLDTEIACRSRLGRGSVFEFCLPLAGHALPSNPGPDEAAPARAAPASAADARHIAVIEDDFMVAQALQVSLEALGMRTAVYGSAEEALADPGIAAADFYISDFRLPGASGLELLDTIQRLTPRRIRAILLTGETSPGWIEIAQSARWPVLFKPVELSKLLALIEAQDAGR